MSRKPFEELAAELAVRDADLPAALSVTRRSMELLRNRAADRVDNFIRAAVERGAEHLAEIEVSPVAADEKHIDCLQFRVSRGRWEVVCVGKPKGLVTLVGPFKRGKPEKPCADHPLGAETTGSALDELLLDLIREATRR